MIILHVFHDKTAADTKLFRDNKEKLISWLTSAACGICQFEATFIQKVLNALLVVFLDSFVFIDPPEGSLCY